MRVNTNISSMSTQRLLAKTSQAIARSLERLGTGSRINSARDDASGLAIGNGLETQVRAFRQAIRNLNDANGLLATAESSMQTQMELVQRMRELALQAANGTNSNVDRSYLDEELQALLSEFNRITATAEFNGVKLLDGSFQTQSVQIGANRGEEIDVFLNSTQASGIFTTSYTDPGGAEITEGTGVFSQGATATLAGGGVLTLADVNGDDLADLLSTGGVSGNQLMVRFAVGDGTFAHSQTIDLASGGHDLETGDLDNDGDTDIVLTGFHGGAVMTRLNDGTGVFSNGSTITGTTWPTFVSIGDVNGDSKNDLVWGNWNQAYFSYSFGNGNGTFQSAVTVGGVNVNLGRLTTGYFNGDNHLDVAILDGWQVRILDGDGAGGFTSSLVMGLNPGPVGIQVDDVNGDGKDDIVVSHPDLISVRLSNGNGTFAAAASVVVSNVINGQFELEDLNGDDDLDIALAGSGGLVQIFDNNGSGNFSFSATYSVSPNLDAVNNLGVGDINGDGVADIVAAHNSAASLALIQGSETTGGPALVTLDNTDLSIATQEDAEYALLLLDTAIDSLTNYRSQIGAQQNRMEYARNTLGLSVENIAEARSRLMDADLAYETSEITRSQILQQAGVSMLTQSNFSLRMVLELLREAENAVR